MLSDKNKREQAEEATPCMSACEEEPPPSPKMAKPTPSEESVYENMTPDILRADLNERKYPAGTCVLPPPPSHFLTGGPGSPATTLKLKSVNVPRPPVTARALKPPPLTGSSSSNEYEPVGTYVGLKQSGSNSSFRPTDKAILNKSELL